MGPVAITNSILKISFGKLRTILSLLNELKKINKKVKIIT